MHSSSTRDAFESVARCHFHSVLLAPTLSTSCTSTQYFLHLHSVLLAPPLSTSCTCTPCSCNTSLSCRRGTVCPVPLACSQWRAVVGTRHSVGEGHQCRRSCEPCQRAAPVGALALPSSSAPHELVDAAALQMETGDQRHLPASRGGTDIQPESGSLTGTVSAFGSRIASTVSAPRVVAAVAARWQH